MNEVEYWTTDEMRTAASRLLRIAESLGGTEQTDIEEAAEALFDAAKQLDSL